MTAPRARYSAYLTQPATTPAAAGESTLGTVDFSTWIPGWASFFAVSLYGFLLVRQAVRVRRARESFETRVLVTGSRGKSGTVRLIHAALIHSGRSAYGKVTGSVAVELLPDGTEKPTIRHGTAGISELPQAIIRAAASGADYGVFECMAISPELIHIVQAKYVMARIVVIPTIRLDHLEDEGLTELEIGMNIFDAIDDCDYVVAGVDQPELQVAYQQWCDAKGITFVLAKPRPDTPLVIGHHPTNVEVARQVLTILGLSDDEACAGVLTASTEPNAVSYYSMGTECGTGLALVDIGSANDPQSAAEALAQWPLDGDAVVPVLANRWDRPLRSVVFAGALIGRYPVVGISGSLFEWVKHVPPEDLPESPPEPGREYLHTKVFKLTHRLASDPNRLARVLTTLLGTPATGRFVLVLTGNTHDPQIVCLRETFEQQGRQSRLEYAD